MADEDWKTSLRDLHRALIRPDAHEEWHIQRVLDRLKPRLDLERFELLSALAAAINQRANLVALAAHPLWQSVCADAES